MPAVESALPLASTAAALDDVKTSRGWRDRVPLLIAAVVFSALSLAAGMSGPGFLEADACTHYQYSRWCFAEPHYLINVWGRPVCTAVYAIPALLGERVGTRIMALLVALGIAAVCYRLAKLQGYRWPALAYIFLLAQPLLFLHSFSELTELPFALMTAVAFLAYRERRWWELALVAGTMPLSRPEGFGFLLLALAALVLHRRLGWIVLLPLPILIWNWGGWQLYGRPGPWWNWLRANWPYAQESLYDRGSLFHFIVLLPMVTSPFLFPAMWIGVWQNLRIGERANGRTGEGTTGSPSPVRRFALAPFRLLFSADHATRCDVLIAALPLLILAGHSVLYWRGKMASNGELRYMLVVAPFWALLAARGWAWVFERLNWGRYVYRAAGVAAILPVFANNLYTVIPLRFDENWQQARKVTEWYEASGVRDRYPMLLSAHPGIPYFIGISPTDPKRAVEWRKESVARHPQGTVLVWDDTYSLFNSDVVRVVPLKDIVAAGWIPARHEKDGYQREWWVFLSPTDVNGRMTPPSDLSVGMP
jgi:hypothetical protein